MVIIDVLAFPDNYLFQGHHQNLLEQKKKRQINICMNRLKKDTFIGLLQGTCILGGVDSEDELPSGIPSATGLPIFWFRASSSASVRGVSAGPPPVLRAFPFFLLAE